ncbi:MAG: glutathione S-transferase family protein [Thermoleophilia bacterium]|nr:glutathione S-transferase family protein [Thermoleophilia bacterium]
MALTLYDNRFSTNAAKVRFLLAELGQPYEAVHVGLGPLSPAGYSDVHPFGTVPALRDGDLLLFESNTMLRYLAMREGRDDLCPAAARERAVVDQAMDALSLSVRPALWGLEEVTIYAAVPPHLGGDDGALGDPALVASRAAALGAVLDGFEAFLAPLPPFTIADCAIAGRLATVPRLPLNLTRWPHLARRLEAAWARPAWAAQLAAAPADPGDIVPA